MDYKKMWACMEELFRETERLRQENQELRNELRSSQDSTAFWHKRCKDMANEKQCGRECICMDDTERSDTF